MWQALAQLFPVALAAAASTVPIMATILILVSDKRDQAAVPYLVGWLLGAIAFLVVATYAAGLLPDDRPLHDSRAVDLLEIAIGGALVVLGLVALRRRGPGEAPLPSWMHRVGSLDSGPAFGVGVALNARPKALLLVGAAGLILQTAALAAEETVVAMGFFILVATSTVIIPVVLTLVVPTRVLPRLNVARDWLAANGPVFTAWTMLAVGAFLVVLGLAH